MGMINAVAIIGFLIMLAMYFPISGYLRNRMTVVEQGGSPRQKQSEKKECSKKQGQQESDTGES